MTPRRSCRQAGLAGTASGLPLRGGGEAPFEGGWGDDAGTRDMRAAMRRAAARGRRKETAAGRRMHKKATSTRVAAWEAGRWNPARREGEGEAAGGRRHQPCGAARRAALGRRSSGSTDAQKRGRIRRGFTGGRAQEDNRPSSLPPEGRYQETRRKGRSAERAKARQARPRTGGTARGGRP